MTNSNNKMAGKNSAERIVTPGRPRSTTKLRPMKVQSNNNMYFNTIATPPRSKSISIPNSARSEANHKILKQRFTPSPTKPAMSPFGKNGSSPSSTSSSSSLTTPSRTSPGLIAGHFAGGKWTEPPSPASLPKPPQHWTQLIFNNSNCSKINGKPQQTDIASQLKVLLNVQA